MREDQVFPLLESEADSQHFAQVGALSSWSTRANFWLRAPLEAHVVATLALSAGGLEEDSPLPCLGSESPSPRIRSLNLTNHEIGGGTVQGRGLAGVTYLGPVPLRPGLFRPGLLRPALV